MSPPGIATLWKPVVNVTDLDKGERFWSAVSGLSPQLRHGQFSAVSKPDRAPEEGWMLLQLVPAESFLPKGGTHLDFRVEDVAAAARQIEEVGGKVLRAPGFYAPEGSPVLEWAVMEDPFGNEFCIIRYPVK